MIYKINAIDENVRGGKFWVCGLVDDKLVPFFIDTGADISIIPPRYIPNTPRIELDQPVKVSGFRGSDPVDVHLQVNVGVSFRPGVIKAKFFVVDVPHAILGNDVLREKDAMLSLITGRDALRVRKDTLFTKDTPTKSRNEYKRRKLLGIANYRHETH